MSQKKVVLGVHARQRMRQRSIDKELVLLTVSSPDMRKFQAGSYLAVRKFPERKVTAVCIETRRRIFVKTVW